MTQNLAIDLLPEEEETDSPTVLAPNRVVLDAPTAAPLPVRKRVVMQARLFCIRVLNYLTNYVVAYVPSFTFRHLWYRRVLGFELGQRRSVHMRPTCGPTAHARSAGTGHASAGTRGSTAIARSMSAAACRSATTSASLPRS